MIIYQLTNKLDGKGYIGQTKYTLEQRVKGHCDPKSTCVLLRNAILKYGIENFDQKILLYADGLEESNYYEELLINKLITLSPNGYNLKIGGRNKFHSQESRKKMSSALKGRSSPTKGMKWTEEQKQKLKGRKTWNKGTPMREESRLKMSAALKSREVWNTGLKIGPRDEGSKKAIGESSRRRYQSGENYGFRNPEVFKKSLETRRANPKPPWNKGLKLPPHSEERKNIISESLKKAYAEGRRG